MFYRVVETGYRLTKFGRHAASCALQGLACGGLVVSAGAVGRSLSGLGNSSGRSALLAGGAALMMLVGLGGHQPAFAQTTQTLVDGNQAGGFRVSAVIGNVSTVPSSVAPGTPSNSSLTVVGANFTNFVTRGGNGSGGGAGLGGVFFVDAGSSLTLNNVSFNTNTAQGGQGGGSAGVRVLQSAAALSTVELNLSAVEGVDIRPVYERTVSLTGVTAAGNVLTFGDAAEFEKISENNRLILGNTVYRVDAVDSIAKAITLRDANDNVPNITSVPSGASTLILTTNADGTAFSTNTAQLQNPNPLIRAGMNVTAGNSSSSLSSVTGSNLIFSTSIATTSIAAPTLGHDTVVVLSGAVLDFSRNNSNTSLTQAQIEQNMQALASAGISVGSYVTGTGVLAGTYVEQVDLVSGQVTLSKGLSGVSPSDLRFINFNSISALPIASAAARTITVSNIVLSAPGVNQLKAGMILSGDGIANGTRIESIASSNGITTIELDRDLSNISRVTGFSAVEPNAVVSGSSTVLTLSPSFDISTINNGMRVSGTTASGTAFSGVITAFNSSNKTITINTVVPEEVNSLTVSPVAAFAAGNNGLGGSLTIVVPQGVDATAYVSHPGR